MRSRPSPYQCQFKEELVSRVQSNATQRRWVFSLLVFVTPTQHNTLLGVSTYFPLLSGRPGRDHNHLRFPILFFSSPNLIYSSLTHPLPRDNDRDLRFVFIISFIGVGKGSDFSFHPVYLEDTQTPDNRVPSWD